MKNKTSLLLFSTVAIVGALISFVSIQGTAVAKSDNAAEAQSNKSNQEKNSNAITASDTAQTADTTATQETEKKEKKEKKENKGQFNAEWHRNTVATFVQSLLTVADREGGIGQEVKVIANKQNDTKDRASDLMNAIENRNKVKTFLIGTSYKNLGELRSQMVDSRNQIEQLKRLAGEVANEGDKAELQTQIQTLEQEQTKINDFITQNESRFSLFGWAVKLFR
ncbi:MAG: hypothetical protein WC906_01410 [Parcubacteria group bacterium]|jgi:hypothetical protein